MKSMDLEMPLGARKGSDNIIKLKLSLHHPNFINITYP